MTMSIIRRNHESCKLCKQKEICAYKDQRESGLKIRYSTCVRTVIIMNEWMEAKMYDDLVKRCRNCIDSLCGECKYEHLQKPGNFVICMNALIKEAADAIEALSTREE